MPENREPQINVDLGIDGEPGEIDYHVQRAVLRANMKVNTRKVAHSLHPDVERDH